MIHRSFANQLNDYQFVAETPHRLKEPHKGPVSMKPRSGVIKPEQVAQRILQGSPTELNYFALHKLYFLAELAALETTGERLTNTYVVGQKDDPYFVDLHLAKLPQLIPDVQIRSADSKALLSFPIQSDFLVDEPTETLSTSDETTIETVLTKYDRMHDGKLKRVIYLSKYMRALLGEEWTSEANLYNTAVLPFSTKE